MNPAIRIDHLSKRYHVNSCQSGAYRTLRETIADSMTDAWRLLRRPSQASTLQSSAPDTFCALDDVSFEVQPGEVVGIIGRNGAGKSTLLKILSRVTEPTSGRVELRGRVGSLLEVGTGFHPELTGRENIYLNGAILGMSAREISRKFDQIVAFAEIERFLDTPVKRYSSGMYVRLAFSVASHLETEILIVDEVLAVGDGEFQRRCLGKMGEVSRSGRTVLFVSHSMAAIKALCHRAVLLQGGAVHEDGAPSAVVQRYMNSFTRADELVHLDDINDAEGPRLTSFQMVDEIGDGAHAVAMRSQVCLEFTFKLARPIGGLHFIAWLLRDDGLEVGAVTSRETPCPPLGAAGAYRVRIPIDELPCLPGRYFWAFEFRRRSQGSYLRRYEHVHSFEVLEDVLPEATHPYTRQHGVCFLPARISVGCDRNDADTGNVTALTDAAAAPVHAFTEGVLTK